MATYTAWDGNEYPMPTPEGWYLAADSRWWPEGHGPGPGLDVPPAQSGQGAGLPSAAPPADTTPRWSTAEETTIYSSPPRSAAEAMQIPDSLRESGSGSGGNGKTFLVLGAVLFALLAIGGGAYTLLVSGDEDEAGPSTSISTQESDVGDTSSDTTEVGGEPSATVSVVPGKGSIEDPYEIGEEIVITYTDEASGEDRTWTVEVLGSTSDITQAVLDENQFNEAPDGDQRFIGVPIRVTYISGPAPASLFELTFKAVGPSGVVLTTFDPSCGVIPNALDTFAEIFEGGAVDGSICWSATPEDASDLTMLIEVFLEDTQIYADISG